jgi:hypothetical protein
MTTLIMMETPTKEAAGPLVSGRLAAGRQDAIKGYRDRVP